MAVTVSGGMIDVITDIRTHQAGQVQGPGGPGGGARGGLDVCDLESVDVLRSPPHILPGSR